MSGVVALVIGVAITVLVSLWQTAPWTLGQALLAVGVSTFFGAFFSAYFTDKRADTG